MLEAGSSKRKKLTLTIGEWRKFLSDILRAAPTKNLYCIRNKPFYTTIFVSSGNSSKCEKPGN